jgi:dihydrodipicolinate synthase/N-acetylneuraminate lyase
MHRGGWAAVIGATLPELWGFPLTPFDAGEICLDRLSAGVEHQVAGGVDVVCACGAIAQADTLSPKERATVLDRVAAQVAGRVPVVATVMDVELETAALAGGIGCAALLVLPTTGDVPELRRRLDALAATGAEQLVLYHRPPLRLQPSDLAALAGCDALTGLKDGHRDVRLHRRLRAALGARLRWLSAWEDVAMPFWALGVRSFAPFSAAYEPRYSRRWLTLLQAGAWDAAACLLELHAYPMTDLRLSRPGIDVSVMHAAMQARGLPSGDARPPALRLTRDERRQVATLVARLPAALAQT